MTYNEIAAPALQPDTFNWGLMRSDGKYSSPLSMSTQSIRRKYRLTCDLTWNELTIAESQLLAAWAEQMDDALNKCRLRDYSFVRQGTATGTPTFVSHATLGQIVVGSLPAGLVGAFVAGDFLKLATGQLVRVADASVDADASGQATVNLTTWMRSVPAASSAIDLATPDCLMEFKKGQHAMSGEAPHAHALSVSLVEFVP